jgi:hypothetical protein
VWNAYNRVPTYLKAGDSTASWTYMVATIRESNGGSTNFLTLFSGLAEDTYDLRFVQNVASAQSSAANQAYIGIGINSTTVISGFKGNIGISAAAVIVGGNGNAVASLLYTPQLGINAVNALEVAANTNGTNTYYGTEANMLLSASWRV